MTTDTPTILWNLDLDLLIVSMEEQACQLGCPRTSEMTGMTQRKNDDILCRLLEREDGQQRHTGEKQHHKKPEQVQA
jgi:hypothetical protein